MSENENENERIVDTDPEILEGEDELPREPATVLDPYTPEPGPRPGDQRAFSVLRWAWIPILAVVVFILIGFFR
jgi:hypothetical protein